MKLIETPHGTVCAACLLWPDTCTCRPDHPMRRILRAAFAHDPDVQRVLQRTAAPEVPEDIQ